MYCVVAPRSVIVDSPVNTATGCLPLFVQTNPSETTSLLFVLHHGPLSRSFTNCQRFEAKFNSEDIVLKETVVVAGLTFSQRAGCSFYELFTLNKE